LSLLIDQAYVLGCRPVDHQTIVGGRRSRCPGAAGGQSCGARHGEKYRHGEARVAVVVAVAVVVVAVVVAVAVA
jgi:hypothetical protein